MLDECSDDSLDRVVGLLRAHVNNTMGRLSQWWAAHGRRLHHQQGNVNGSTYLGDRGGAGAEEGTAPPEAPIESVRACLHFGLMVQARVVVAPTPLFETMSENR